MRVRDSRRESEEEMMRRKSFPIAVMFVLGIVAGTGYVLASHNWGCYRWPTTSVGYKSAAAQTTVVRNARDYKSAFSGAASTWKSTIMSLTSGSDLKLYYGAYGNNGWLGIAQIWPSGCTITRAESKLNDSYLRDTSRYNQTAVDHVACQEIGHTFGLDHNRGANDTCMNDSILTAGNKINQHDKDQLVAIYN